MNVEDGFYVCFVCGAQGGTYLLQKHFGDTPEKPQPGVGNDPLTRRKILNWAADVGHEWLFANDDVLFYLLNDRGLTLESVLIHKLGLVVKPWSLTGNLPEDFTRKELLDTGLVWREGPRAGDDYFYNHLLLPFIQRGNVVGMRGRAWPKDAKGAKYLTGQGDVTRLFNVDALDGADDVVITEGEFDAMVLQQHLRDSGDERAARFAVIGLSGVNGFPDGAETYFANAKRIYIGFDPDEPGRRAAAAMKERFGSRARIIELPQELPKADWTEYLLPVPDNATHEWRDEHPHAGHNWQDVMALVGNAAGKRLFSVRETGFSYRQQKAEKPEGIKTGFLEFDAKIHPGILPGQVMVVLAKTGCMAGDTVVKVNRAGKTFDITLQDMHDRWIGNRYAWELTRDTYVQRAEGDVVRLGKVHDVWSCGVKTTYSVTTDSGRIVRAAAEHPFLTDSGWRELHQLNAGDRIAANAGRSSVGRQSKVHYYIRSGLVAHPFAGRRNVAAGGHSVPLHRLVVEAARNGLELNDFLGRCRSGDVDGLRFLDPSVHVVHHLDHDPHNNNLTNLEVLTGVEHATRHAEEGTARNVLERVDFETVVSITEYGQEETYDLSVAGEPHNYLANGLVVHNTGKTVFLCNLAWNTRQHKQLFISLEMTKEEVYERLRRIALFHHPRWSDDQVEGSLQNIYIVDENRLSERDIVELVDEFEVETGERPVMAYIDYLGYFARGCKGRDQYEKVSNAVMALKGIAKAGKIAVVCPAQVNRGAVEGKPIDLDDARDSGVIEETSDFLISLWRPDDGLKTLNENETREHTGKIKMTILKSRHGGKDTVVPLQMDLLTLAVVDDSGSVAKRAWDHTKRYFQGLTYDALRTNETRPLQSTFFGKNDD